MGAPHKFLRKLHDVIGAEATDAMAEWMVRTDEKLDELRADLAELRHDMNNRFAAMDAKFAAVDTKFAAVDTKFAAVDVKFAEAESRASQRHSDLIRWMLGFWVASIVTYVGAVVALANVLK